MSVSSTVTPRTSYSGNGSTTSFSVPFVFIDQDDLVVILTDSSGTDTTQTITTHYTVTGGDSNPETGSITMVTPPASGETLTIYRRIALTQDNDFKPYEIIDSEVHEAALDRLTLIAQDLQDQVNLAVTISETSGLSSLTFPDPEASKIIAWKSDATGLENVDMSDAVLNINALTAETSIDGSADYLPIYDASEGANNKVLVNNLPVNISGLTALSSVDSAADYVIVYDSSDAVNKKVLVQDIPQSGGNAPTSATYVTLTTNATLTNERTLSASTAISITDNGAGNTVQIAVNVNGPSEDTSPDGANDFVLAYDTSATATKKVKMNNLPVDINGKTEDTSPDVTADYILTYDASAATNKKVKLQNIGGDYVFLASATASGSSSVDFTGLSSTYNSYVVVVTNLTPATDGAYLWFRTSTDNGSTFTSSANTYTSYYGTAGTASGGLDNMAQINLSGVDLDNTSGNASSTRVWIHDAASASRKTNVFCSSLWVDTTTPAYSSVLPVSGGYRSAAEANNAIRFLMSTGNIATGTFRLYGVR